MDNSNEKPQNSSLNEIISNWLKDRFSTGFLINFLIYWVYFNWKAIFIVVFDSKPTKTGEILEKLHYYHYDNFQIWEPLILSLITTAIWPFIGSSLKYFKFIAIDCYWLLIEKTNSIKPASKELYARAINENRNLWNRYKDAIGESQNLKNEIFELKQIIQDKESEKQELIKEVSKLNFTYNPPVSLTNLKGRRIKKHSLTDLMPNLSEDENSFQEDSSLSVNEDVLIWNGHEYKVVRKINLKEFYFLLVKNNFGFHVFKIRTEKDFFYVDHWILREENSDYYRYRYHSILGTKTNL